MTIRRRVAAVSIAGMLAFGLTSAANAADSTVTQGVTEGTRAASVANLTLTEVAYSHAEQTSVGTLGLSVDGATGTGGGWNVTVQSSDFVYTGDHNGQDIDATHLVMTGAHDPVFVSGDPIDATAGPNVPGELEANASLEVARKVVQADTGSGEGSYTQDLGVELTIPSMSRVGTYTGTLTTTITAGP